MTRPFRTTLIRGTIKLCRIHPSRERAPTWPALLPTDTDPRL